MTTKTELKVTVLDMQPIDPPTGGGRLRLFGLYRGLGPNIRAQYVGSYDWPGPGVRRQNLSDMLEEVLVPLSSEHFGAAESRAKAVGGKTIIDVTFHRLGTLSTAYVTAARNAAAEADIVVFSHPWVFPLVRETLEVGRQLIVYDAQNVEGLLRTSLLDDGGVGSEVAREVVAVEAALCHAAQLILACSQVDREAFSRIYDVPPERVRVVPNGAFTEALQPPTVEERARLRSEYSVTNKPLAVFLGSKYGPNLEAARFIGERLAVALPGVEFVVVGGAGDGVPKGAPVRAPGVVSETEKLDWLRLADVAINPMFSGSGTNIKMLEYMSAGLPVITTPIGARGIETGRVAFAVAEPSEFSDRVAGIVADSELRKRLGGAARVEAMCHYSWERISGRLGHILQNHFVHYRKEPFFSIVVATFERHVTLCNLIELLALQSFRDFEVIVVDQSREPWAERDRSWGVDLRYVWTDVRGAVAARNVGASIACGSVIAFTDDDCEPSLEWLAAAQRVLDRADIAGLEGLILSDHLGDPEWRPVTNGSFEGGFMTANLFIRSRVFHAIGGFDLRFDHPHFREDTDLGWRAEKHGAIPFSREAWVFHPAQPRSVERESLANRSLFFEKDALLLLKHPRKYCELFEREGQWRHNPLFWQNFLQGVDTWGIELPPSIARLVPEELRQQIRR